MFVIMLIGIKSLFLDLPAIFRGDYNNSDAIEEIKKEVFSDNEVPTYLNDRTNLKNDFKLISQDFKKAQKAYIDELI